MTGPVVFAAVDLGSNSFRLVIARAGSAGARRIEVCESLKRTVRLAAGLQDDDTLDLASQQRALDALSCFGQRLRAFQPEAVRAVATNTLRVARNADGFLRDAETALGVRIEVISGHEEARLIYAGASHCLPEDGRRRLVVDVGGGSTECVLGVDRHPLELASAAVGCVALSQRFFRDGSVDQASFEQARGHAQAVFEPVARRFRHRGWDYALGTSGTAKALAHIAQLAFGASGLDREGLKRIRACLLRAGDAERLEIAGLESERRPVLAGGLAVMTAAFDAFAIEALAYCDGALRHGVLHDLRERCDRVPRWTTAAPSEPRAAAAQTLTASWPSAATETQMARK